MKKDQRSLAGRNGRAERVARLIGVTWCAAALGPWTASAQTIPGHCFEPRPTCTSFWITELNGYHALSASRFTEQTAAGPVIRHALREHFNVSIGGMVRRGPTTALGAAVMLGDGPEGQRVGLEVRARRWLTYLTSIDASAGPLEATVDAHSLSVRAHGYGVGGDISLMAADWIGLTVRGEVLRSEGRTVHAVYGGVRLGTYPAVVTAAGIAALIGLLTVVSD